MKISYSFFGWFMALDSFSLIMLLIVNLTAALTMVYFVGQGRKPLHYAALLVLLLGLNAILISTDILSIFVLLEASGFAAYLLSGKSLNRRISFAYFGSFMMLAAIAGLLFLRSTLNIAEIGKFLIGQAPNEFYFYCFIIFLSGALVKIVFTPLRLGLIDVRWPLGLYIFLRLVFWPMYSNVLFLGALKWLGICFMLLGAFLAIGQFSLRKMLIYFSLSNIGCILFGLALTSPLSLAGALFHLLSYILFYQLIVYSAGIKEGVKDNSLSGNYLLIGLLSNGAVAPLNGFWGRAMIIIAAFQLQEIMGAIVVILSAVVMLACPLKLRKYPSLTDNAVFQDELASPHFTKILVVVLAFFCITGGLFAIPIIDKIIKPATGVLLGI